MSILSRLSIVEKFLIALIVALTGYVVTAVAQPNEAHASPCFDTPAERANILPIRTYFPRAQLAKDASNCAELGSTESWSLVSSFYYSNSSSHSSLQTGRSRFTLFQENRATAPPASQTIRVRWDDANSRCRYLGWPSESTVQVWIVDLHSGGGNWGWQNLGQIDLVPGQDYQDFTFNARWVNGGTRYGNRNWKSEMAVVIAASDFANSTISCRVRVASRSGSTITFTEQVNNNPFTETQQRFNWSNWQTSSKRYLGPGGGGTFSGGSAYALYSSGGSGRRIEYALPFAASCDITTPTTVTRLRVYDMDHPTRGVGGDADSAAPFSGGASAGPKQSGTPYMRLYDLDANITVPVNGLPANGEVRISNDEYGEYSATIQTDRRYAWVFWNVQANNGVQIWMPYSEVHASFGCPASDWNLEPQIFRGGSATTVGPGGTISALPRIRNTGTDTAPAADLMDLYPTGSTASWVWRDNGTPGGSAYGTDGVRYYPPGARAGGSCWNHSSCGSNVYQRWRVSTSAPNGTSLCFAVRVAPDSPTNSGFDPDRPQVCWTVDRNIYVYTPEAVIPSQTYARFYAGETFDARARVRNTSSGATGATGPSYDQDISFSTLVNTPRTLDNPGNYPGLAPGAAGQYLSSGTSRRFTVSATAPHGAPVSCSNRVNPGSGLGPPSPFTYGSPRTTTTNCFTVENRRWSIGPIASADVTFTPSILLPGEDFRVTTEVCNDGSTGAGVQLSTARRVRTRTLPQGTNITTRTAVDSTLDFNANQCRSYIYEGTVSTSAQLGDEVCVRTRVDRTQGFSQPAPNGFRGGGTLQSPDVCVDVAEQAYFEVVNGSSWSGGGFPDASRVEGYGQDWCSPLGEGRIRTASLNGVAGWSDYVTGAVGLIQNLGSGHINSPFPVNGSDLTFANIDGGTPTLGNFGEGRCITDLSRYLSDDTTRTGVRDLGASSTAWPSSNGQWVRNGNLTINTQTISGGPSADRFTIYVNGTVTIAGDITFDNYRVSDKSEIPSLIIVATGGINVNPGVQNIEGIFFTNGEFDTCNAATTYLTDGICGDRLTVVGTVAARDIEFRRTHGGVSGGNTSATCPSGTCPAEQFIFSPEAYLADHILISEHTPRLTIEQLIDLPPVIN